MEIAFSGIAALDRDRHVKLQVAAELQAVMDETQFKEGGEQVTRLLKVKSAKLRDHAQVEQARIDKALKGFKQYEGRLVSQAIGTRLIDAGCLECFSSIIAQDILKRGIVKPKINDQGEVEYDKALMGAEVKHLQLDPTYERLFDGGSNGDPHGDPGQPNPWMDETFNLFSSWNVRLSALFTFTTCRLEASGSTSSSFSSRVWLKLRTPSTSNGARLLSARQIVAKDEKTRSLAILNGRV